MASAAAIATAPFDAKGAADWFFAERGLPVTLLHTSFCTLGQRRGLLQLALGRQALPGIRDAESAWAARIARSMPRRVVGIRGHDLGPERTELARAIPADGASRRGCGSPVCSV
jgi:hypothetical protein